MIKKLCLFAGIIVLFSRVKKEDVKDAVTDEPQGVLVKSGRLKKYGGGN
jgi:hypothetical protein